jgi:hypothetical protein
VSLSGAREPAAVAAEAVKAVSKRTIGGTLRSAALLRARRILLRLPLRLSILAKWLVRGPTLQAARVRVRVQGRKPFTYGTRML